MFQLGLQPGRVTLAFVNRWPCIVGSASRIRPPIMQAIRTLPRSIRLPNHIPLPIGEGFALVVLLLMGVLGG